MRIPSFWAFETLESKTIKCWFYIPTKNKDKDWSFPKAYDYLIYVMVDLDPKNFGYEMNIPFHLSNLFAWNLRNREFGCPQRGTDSQSPRSAGTPLLKESKPKKSIHLGEK